MDKFLENLYDSFYTPPDMEELKQETKACYQTLLDRLDKPEQRLVLKIIDDKDIMAENLSLDSFVRGFQLAWSLTNELAHYQSGHPMPDVHSLSE